MPLFQQVPLQDLIVCTVINNYKGTSYPRVVRQSGKEWELTVQVYICVGI